MKLSAGLQKTAFGPQSTPEVTKSASIWDSAKKLLGGVGKYPAVRSEAMLRAGDRALVRRGTPYVMIGKPPNDFNPSGFLRRTKAPTPVK